MMKCYAIEAHNVLHLVTECTRSYPNTLLNMSQLIPLRIKLLITIFLSQCVYKSRFGKQLTINYI